MLYSGVWGSVCDDYWDNNDATVVCRMLGLSTEGAQAVGGAEYVYVCCLFIICCCCCLFICRFGGGVGQIWLDDVECDGSELDLTNCPRSSFGDHNCNHGEDAGVICQIPDPPIIHQVRLNGTRYPYEGIVEVGISILYNEWLSVCGDGFTFPDAEVVCRQLGYPGVLKFFREGIFRATYAPILITQLGCRGEETQVANCNIL